MNKIKKIFRNGLVAALTLWAAPAVAADAPVQTGRPVDWQMGMQPPASPGMVRLESFYMDILTPIIFAIAIFVLILLAVVILKFNARANPKPSRTAHNTLLEVIWTMVPVLVLVVIIVPSMKLLYFLDRTADADMTLKVVGYQWYWGYEYPDHGDVAFDSYMIPDADLKEGQLRLLATDNPVVLPVDTNVRLLITAADVIHSWAVPSLGVKLDAVPGRLNETWVRIEKEGLYYGQCSELCGVRHAFMPIEIKAVSKADFAQWVESRGGKMPDPATQTTTINSAPEKGAATTGEQ